MKKINKLVAALLVVAILFSPAATIPVAAANTTATSSTSKPAISADSAGWLRNEANVFCRKLTKEYGFACKYVQGTTPDKPGYNPTTGEFFVQMSAIGNGGKTHLVITFRVRKNGLTYTTVSNGAPPVQKTETREDTQNVLEGYAITYRMAKAATKANAIARNVARKGWRIGVRGKSKDGKKYTVFVSKDGKKANFSVEYIDGDYNYRYNIPGVKSKTLNGAVGCTDLQRLFYAN